MVVSINPETNDNDFKLLLKDTVISLQQEAIREQDKYLLLNGNKLENKVVDVMNKKAKGTPFENSIELISGQRFPDIIANRFYGVEVKTTKSNHWKSTGSSVAEGTRIEGIERIFMLFGKMCNPIQFMCKAYEDCLSEVVVTHSPRYLIDMNLSKGETFFDKIQISYDELRKQDNPIKTILGYYKKQMRKGDNVWWLDNDNDIERASSLIIKMWNNLSTAEKSYYRIKGYCLFPELVSNRSDKFYRFALWLSTGQGIVCANIRDIFTAGGRGELLMDNRSYTQVPQVILHLYKDLSLIKESLIETSAAELSNNWGCTVTNENKFLRWKELICENIQDKGNKLLAKEILNVYGRSLKHGRF
ncbi:MAG: hypothetical protein RRX93_08135 [Bacteroidales bacterium]